MGGNCHDRPDQNGVLTHCYGPHYFRSNSLPLVDYLSRFTTWHKTRYEVKSFTEGRYWSFPINLITFEQLMGRKSSRGEFIRWLERNKIHIAEPKNSEEVVISKVGVKLYEKFFKGYTQKQWGEDPKCLHPSICARIPIRTVRDEAYCNETFQAMPRDGYTAMFKRLADACGRNLDITLGLDFSRIKNSCSYRHLIYTGPIDDYFEACYGKLDYRSLRFEMESYNSETLGMQGKNGFWQPYLQVNYPNSESYTRIVEIKHATGQNTPNTSIVREYPQDYTTNNEPYYPMPTNRNLTLFQKYSQLAAAQKRVTFLGRLATYSYINMDQAVCQALNTFRTRFAANLENK